MSELKISCLSDDNGNSSFRAQRIRLAGKEAITPCRSLEPTRLRSKVPIDLGDFRFLEVYREVSGEQALTIHKDSSAHDEFSARTRILANSAPPESVRICIVKYVPDAVAQWPDENAVHLLADVAHSYSDLVPIPAVQQRIELANYGKFETFVRDAYRSIERLNNKPVMGYLPLLPREAYPRILRFYLEQGIRSFYFDFEGRMPDHLKLRPLLAFLAEKRELESSILYGLNARPGKFLRNARVIPSKDFIAHGYGMDVLGGRHTRPPFAPPPTPGGRATRLNGAIQDQAGNRRRLFLPADYGYHQLSSPSSSGGSYPRDSRVPMNAIFADESGSLEKLFNMEQHAKESVNLGRKLCHLGKKESILDYVSTKSQARSELPRLRKRAQATLDVT
jgi:hypothetical protein